MRYSPSLAVLIVALVSPSAAFAADLSFSPAIQRQFAQGNLIVQQSLAASAHNMFWVAATEALITLVGVALVAFTLAATRRAAVAAENAVKETRRIGEAQVRAYLSCEQGQYIYGHSGLPMGISVSAVVRNFGQSPAINVRVRARLGAFAPPDLEERGRLVVLLGSIPASGEQAAPLFWSKDDTAEPIKNQLFEKGFPIRVAAELEWTDVFGKSHLAIFDLAEAGSPPTPPGPRNTFAGSLGVTMHFQPYE